jgi:hypothetical protein
MERKRFITLFETHEEYEAFIVSGDYVRPNVSYCQVEKDVHYDDEVSPVEPIYQWVVNGTVCVGYDKHAKEIKQVSYDSGATWIDTREFRPGELIEANSVDCGYIPPEYMEQWVQVDTMCDGFNKYAVEKKQFSNDGGVTWEDTEETRQGGLIEENSFDCGYVAYQWVENGETMCDGFNKYKVEKKQQTTDGETWVDVDPAETRRGELIEMNSEDCGYVPPVVQYQWVVDGYTCDENFNKYAQEKRQQSTDGGETWTDVVPAETRVGTLIEENSVDCGYVPPVEPIYKWEEDGEILDNGNKYVKERKYVSYDNGETWEYTGISRNGELIEENVYTVDYEDEYMTLRILEPGTLALYDTSGDFAFADPRLDYPISGDAEWSAAEEIYYSRDNGETWKEYHAVPEEHYQDAEVLTVEAGEKILWKAVGQSFGYNFVDGVYFDGFDRGYMPRFDVEGNIMSTIYGDDFRGKISLNHHEYAFGGMFSLTSVKHAHNLVLPAEILSFGCYQGLFRWCEWLETAPQLLPAENMKEYCYRYMFEDCHMLTEGPEFTPQTTAYECFDEMFSQCSAMTVCNVNIEAGRLVSGCCQWMFYGCKALTEATDLDYASTVEQFACRGMYENCFSLTKAPRELPAVSIERFSYGEMFRGCSALTTSPIIRVRNMETHSAGCARMFYGCSSLNHVTAAIINYEGSSDKWDDCNTNAWLEGVAAHGVFYKHPLINYDEHCGGWEIPCNWEVHDIEGM